MLQDAAEMFVFLAVELSLLFIVISAGVSLIRQKVPDHKIQQRKLDGEKHKHLCGILQHRKPTTHT